MKGSTALALIALGWIRTPGDRKDLPRCAQDDCPYTGRWEHPHPSVPAPVCTSHASGLLR